MTWENAIENYRTYLVLERSLSSNSVEAYLSDIQKLAGHCAEEYGIQAPEEVTYDLLKEYLIQTSKTGVSNRTQARCISSLRSFFKFLVFDGKMENNPTRLLESPKLSRTLPDILTVKEVDDMLDAVDMNRMEGPRNKAIVEMLFSCGLRVSELVNLKLSNVNFRLGIVKVEGKGNKERMIPLSKSAKMEIMRYQESFRDSLNIKKGYEDILFLNNRGSALTRVMVFQIIKNLAQQAGIRKHVSPHTFRHSFASHLVSGGADLRAVQDLLGHETILTTEIYTHLDNRYLRDTVEKYHPRSNKRPQSEK